MGDAVREDFSGRRLGSLNRILPGVAVKQNVQFRHFRNPAPVDFAIKLDCQLHTPMLARRGFRRSQRRNGPRARFALTGAILGSVSPTPVESRATRKEPSQCGILAV